MDEAEDKQKRQNMQAGLVSLIVHLVLFIVLGLLAVHTPEPLVLRITPAEPREMVRRFDTAAVSLPLDVMQQPPQDPSPDLSTTSLLSDVPQLDFAASRLASSVNLDTGEQSLTMLRSNFSSMISDAQRHGIEFVIVFDSTGSMGSEINVVKARIRLIGQLILSKLPKAEFSLVTYRDRGDQYVARGVPLTRDLSTLQNFIDGVHAAGGGNRPESVLGGMLWAMNNNRFRPSCQKVMLIFGDAPPHVTDLGPCFRLAERFRKLGKARINTVTCRDFRVLPEFYRIAQAGGGEAYHMTNTARLMEELLINAFGSEYQEEAAEFFELDMAF